jgi:hypothetical protein
MLLLWCRTEVSPPKAVGSSIPELDGEQVRISLVACLTTYVVFQHIYDFPVPPVEPLVVRVRLVGDVDPNTVACFNPSHYLLPDSEDSCL